jgi:phage terminase large subunit-like protein
VAPEELDRFCGFAERFLTDESSRPLVIERWQREILADYFAGTRELVVLVSKKNGKTSLFAGLALWHVITVAFADVAILAASRDQAGKLLSQLTGYVKRSPELREQLRITQRVVPCDRTDGKVAVMAADSDTLDGWGGTLALVDELGRHKSEENFGLLRDGLGPRDGQLVAFSTAGDDEDSALGRIRARAHEIPGFGPAADNPKHKIGRAEGFAFHEWSLDRGDDSDNLELVALANPASWLDAEALRARKASPSMQEWQWKRFTCGLWVAGEDSALSATDWAACADSGAVIPDGAHGVVIGGDLGYRVDTTAFIPAWRETAEDPIILGKPIILTPPGDGGSISIEDMVEACLSFARRYPACTFSFDPKAGGEQLLQRLERELPDTHEFIEFPQMTGRLCGASMRFAELVGAGMIRHPDDEELTAHVLAASAKFVGERWRFGRPRGQRKPIDALTASMVGVDWLASKPAPAHSPYEDRGVIAA